jgi:hypothetical protein
MLFALNIYLHLCVYCILTKLYLQVTQGMGSVGQDCARQKIELRTNHSCGE